jgi:diguanylate cyclase (GGDEF)-like protein
MTSWDNQFRELKNQFIGRSKERLVAIETLLSRLHGSPDDVGLLRLIMQHFHWLAGSGGTYGFEEVTQWGTYGEELCDYLLKLQTPVSFDDQQKLLTALRTVEQLFAAHTPAEAETQGQPRMKNTVELLIPPGSNIVDVIQAANRPAQENLPPQTGAPLPGLEYESRNKTADKQSNTMTGTFPGFGPGMSNSRTTSQFPAQTRPGTSEQTRVLNPTSPDIQAPPLSAPVQEANVLPPMPGSLPSTATTGEFKRPQSKLSRIPPDAKLGLILDSNPANLIPIKSVLEERGLYVENFITATEAKAAFAERLPDVLIIGVPLIDSTGYDLVESLRSFKDGHKPIVLLLGQQAVFVDKVKAIRAGADAFFEYPSELPDIVEKLHSLLDRNRSEKYKVLSVEDDPDQASFIKLTLESAGCTVLHISDPKQFEEAFLSFEPDLVLLDIVLGDMTGFELAKYIRQSDRFATLPIVFLTTQNKLAQHIRSAMSGGDEHLIKPVAPQLLVATVASRVERARSLKRLIDRDGLTRCLNYGSFMDRAQKLATLDGYRSAPAMMMIDIDNMKKINEHMGYAAGDRIISNIANMLLKGFRNTDLIARFGNDQFAIVLEHLNAQQLQSLSSQVLGAISGTPQLVKGKTVQVTCSGGIAVLEQGMTVQEWLASSQDALKKAKESGGNRAIVKPITRV